MLASMLLALLPILHVLTMLLHLHLIDVSAKLDFGGISPALLTAILLVLDANRVGLVLLQKLIARLTRIPFVKVSKSNQTVFILYILNYRLL